MWAEGTRREREGEKLELSEPELKIYFCLLEKNEGLIQPHIHEGRWPWRGAGGSWRPMGIAAPARPHHSVPAGANTSPEVLPTSFPVGTTCQGTLDEFAPTSFKVSGQTLWTLVVTLNTSPSFRCSLSFCC